MPAPSVVAWVPAGRGTCLASAPEAWKGNARSRAEQSRSRSSHASRSDGGGAGLLGEFEDLQAAGLTIEQA
eukprot:8903628-Alexandrium_andersonii.AAC.1